MENTVSVIVPIYKVEKYLKNCVDSILQQTYRHLEIILVDDGSPDGCPQICDEYKSIDSRIVVIHKQNEGVSAARNAALDIATGSYIMFVDGDDSISPYMCENLYQLLQQDHSDAAMCSVECIYEPGCNIEPSPIVAGGLPSGTITARQALEKTNDNWLYIVMCNKLYKKELFDHYRFPVGKGHEDEFAAHHILGQCKLISLTSERLYFYLRRADSTMGQPNVFKVKQLNYVEALIDRYRFLKESGYMDLYKNTLFCCYWILYDYIDRAPDKKMRKTAKQCVHAMFRELHRMCEWKSALRLRLKYYL